MKKKIYNLMMLTVIFALALTACASKPTAATPSSAAPVATTPDGIMAEGKLRPIHASNLSFQVRGIVAEVNVKIGDQVKKGDVLARLANSDVATAQLTAANLELLNAQYALDTLNRTGGANLAATWTAYQQTQIVRAVAQKAWDDINPTDIQTRIDDQQATVNDKKKAVDDAQDEFNKYKDLDVNNSKRKSAEDKLRTAQKDYDTAVADLEAIEREHDGVRAALDAALANEAEAKHQYELSTAGVNKDQLGLTEARLENAKAQVAAAEANLSNYQLTAPFDGVVAEVAVKVGEQVTAETRAVSVADTSSWIIETTDTTELEVVNLVIGQKATFTADALPGVTMDGTVTEISQSSYTQGGDVIYTVRLEASNIDPRIKWGMTVEVTFEPLQ
ncbi:MAG: efflux RND transporter periplasmic adaptor subunit [Chloroflexota bacterium]